MDQQICHMLLELKRELSIDSKILLYPSSCEFHPQFESLPLDAVLLCSNSFKLSSRYGKVFCFKCDNNLLLNKLFEHDIKVNHLMLVRDGCSEGGNYECTNTATFFGRLLPVLSDSCSIVIDHKINTDFFDIPVDAEPASIPRLYRSLLAKSHPINRCVCWNARKKRYPEFVIRSEPLRVAVRHDSIFNDLSKLDLLCLHSKKLHGFFHYFGLASCTYVADTDCDQYYGLVFKNKRLHFFPAFTKLQSIKPFLDYASENSLTALGFMPFAAGRNKDRFYKKIWAELLAYKPNTPMEIAFYHLNREDFSFFYNLE